MYLKTKMKLINYNIPYYKGNLSLLKGPMDYYISPTYIK